MRERESQMNTIELPSTTVEITVPSTIHFDQPLTEEQHLAYVTAIAAKFDKWFGGATVSPQSGFYKGVFEKSSRVWSYADPTPAQKRAVMRLGAWLRAALDQESILVKVDDAVLLIFE
jgi:hypothetical protein